MWTVVAAHFALKLSFLSSANGVCNPIHKQILNVFHKIRSFGKNVLSNANDDNYSHLKPYLFAPNFVDYNANSTHTASNKLISVHHNKLFSKKIWLMPFFVLKFVTRLLTLICALNDIITAHHISMCLQLIQVFINCCLICRCFHSGSGSGDGVGAKNSFWWIWVKYKILVRKWI